MSHLIRACLLLLLLTASATAQQFLFVDSVLLHSGAPRSVDRPVFRVFGFGGEYTDSIDARLTTGREKEVPAFPPDGFFVLFDALTVPGLIDRDVRGLPDSVRSGRAQRFSIRHEFLIQREADTLVTIAFPRPFPPNIDSINFRDVLGGVGGIIFNETITSGPDSAVVPRAGLDRVRMIVYYNATGIPTSIPREHLAARQPLRVIPSPVRAGMAARAIVDAPSSARLDVVNQVGQIVRTYGGERLRDGQTLDVAGLTAGVYAARAVAPDGRILGVRTFVISD